jgi:hypothetical protein
MATKAGYHIDLMDGDAFYEALKIGRRPAFNSQDVQTLIERAEYTLMSDTGTRDFEIGTIYNPDRLKRLPGPGGPHDDWP